MEPKQLRDTWVIILCESITECHRQHYTAALSQERVKSQESV